ncbi:hypothetical protein Riv7116_0194 [Rivularia sp. PCC 7116]|uniref:hypothetical protein n=1 Tax=Rivularia sp. PCC 7116 TaxID=373994 RepID=UPI00029EE259|nr:hypothetical protein [Rivularia sp. PCC 7116]AFY52802.1 hypothetical protein Riv7116_0194 [Rivularia sp. PCC 7116]
MLDNISVTDAKLPEFEGKQHKLPLPQYPKLAASVNQYQNQIIFSQQGRDFAFQVNSQSEKALHKVLTMMDGKNSLTKLQQTFSPSNPEAINTLLRYLDDKKLLDDADDIKINSGLDVLLELENLSYELVKNKSTQNQLILIAPDISNLSINIIYGFAIEAYHLLAHQAYIDASSLSFQGSTVIRQLINQLYCQEYGQDKFLIEALNSIGIDNEDLIDTMPLPQTTAMCNSLAYWASFDTLFYFSILGFLANQNLTNFTYYLQACESLKVNYSFIESIQNLVNHFQKSKLDNISHKIFQQISHIDEQTKQRLQRQVYLFIETYTNYHNTIFYYYSSSTSLLRRVSDI